MSWRRPPPGRASPTRPGSSRSGSGGTRAERLLQDGCAVLWRSVRRACAILGLLELRCLTEVVRGARVVATVGKGVERPVPREERIGAERPTESRTVGGTDERVTEDLGLTAGVRDGRPGPCGGAVAEGDSLDLQWLEEKPA